MEAVIVVLCVGVLVEVVALHLGRCSYHNLKKKEKEMHEGSCFKHANAKNSHVTGVSLTTKSFNLFIKKTVFLEFPINEIFIY